jgi:glycosyltransferase involved in cell wall biosynthesis
MDAIQRIRSEVPDFEMLFIGDGPLRSVVQNIAARYSWIRWVGGRIGREKVLHALLGQLILNPGLVGLGILDSFALGIPMVTTDCGIHSPEIAYLKSGYNGLMTNNSVESFVRTVVDIYRNELARERLSNACMASSCDYSLEAMSTNFASGIRKALEG